MLELLEFILRDTTNFLGTLILIYITGYSIAMIVDSIKGNGDKKE